MSVTMREKEDKSRGRGGEGPGHGEWKLYVPLTAKLLPLWLVVMFGDPSSKFAQIPALFPTCSSSLCLSNPHAGLLVGC